MHLSEEHLGSLCYLVQVMEKTVSSMYLTSESKQQIRHDLGEVVRFKTPVRCICASDSTAVRVRPRWK